MADQFDAHDAQPLNPLMDPLDQPAKSWPKVIGIISIVWASLGLICNGCGAIASVIPGLAAGMMPQGQTMPQTPPLAIVLNVAAFLWAILLMVAAIKTLGRSPVGRPMHLVWAAGSVPMIVVATFIGYQISQQQWQAQVQHMQSDPKMAQQAQWFAQNIDTFAIATSACAAVLRLAWPAFCLIWFGVIKPRSEEIAEGVVEPVA